MSLFSKILLGLVLLVVVYALWPRHPQLHKINPEAAARMETTAWQALQEGNHLKAAFNYYQLYDFQFRISPVQAWNMARANTAAITKVLTGKSEAAEGLETTEFVEVYTLLQKETGAPISAPEVGRAAYGIWARLADGTSTESLQEAIIFYWEQLFLHPTLELKRPAALRADAMLAAFAHREATVDWEKVQALLTSSWQELVASFPPQTDGP